MATKPLIELVQELPPDLVVEVRDFIEFLLEKHRRKAAGEDEVTNFWQGASTSSLDAVWDNAEDDVYAELLKA
jgi:hypothetical protein